jgi:hypothetical protein
MRGKTSKIALVSLLAGSLIGNGCGSLPANATSETNKAETETTETETPVKRPVKTSDEIARDYFNASEKLRKRKKEEAQGYREDFDSDLDAFNSETDRLYEDLLERIRERKKEFDNYRDRQGGEK